VKEEGNVRMKGSGSQRDWKRESEGQCNSKCESVNQVSAYSKEVLFRGFVPYVASSIGNVNSSVARLANLTWAKFLYIILYFEVIFPREKQAKDDELNFAIKPSPSVVKPAQKNNFSR
jgi:hypothetical protein